MLDRAALTVSAFAVLALQFSAPAIAADYLCQVMASDRVEIASPVPGILEALGADRGERVTKGQVVATLRADVERAEVALAEAKASSLAGIKSKDATAAFEQRKLTRNQDMRQRNLVSEHDFDQMTTTRDTAAFDAEAARDAQRIAALELERARAHLSLRIIRSPTDGIVTARNLSPGNLVGERPILVIERTDPLFIEVALPVAHFGGVAKGMRYPVTFDVPGVVARDVAVFLVDTTIDAASNTFGVRFVLPNADGRVPAGAKCRLTIEAGVGRSAAVR